jgi:penicillin-binding protein A
MQTFLRIAAFIGALLLVMYGIGEDGSGADHVWLPLLALAGLLLIVAWRPRTSRTMPVFNRSMLRVTTIILVCFFLVSIQLVRIQIVESGRITDRSGLAPDGDLISNPRHRLAALERQRGRILDVEGRVLADTVLLDDGTYARTWPEPTTAALIGYYSPQMYGSSNIEAAYDEYLMGERGGNPAANWLRGILHERERGHDLALTIDLDLQRQADELLAGRPGAIILMDANTGAVLVMAGAPGFDPNRLYANEGQQSDEEIAAIQEYWAQLNQDPNAPLIFRPTQGLYNPGSTFKTVTAAAIIDSSDVNAGTVYRDEGILEVDGRIIEEANRPDPTKVDYTLEESYAWSLNVVFAQIGLQLRAQTLWDYAVRFGFEDELPFPLGTFASQVANSRDELNNRALLADTGFGQGQILATPLQMAMVVAAVANDGWMMEPYVIDRVLNQEGEALTRFSPREWRRPISGDTASTMRQLMIASTTYGYARGGGIEGLVVGGKTGTAELGEGEPHSWYTAFAESGERTLVVAVVVERGGPGSQTAMPIGTALLQAAFAGQE